VERLALRLGRAGVELPEGATMRTIGERASTRWPPAAAEVSELVRLAELEMYSPEPGAQQREVRRLWCELRRGMRAARAQ
jgi:hypothetical protein